jgi:hypothetical protein
LKRKGLHKEGYVIKNSSFLKLGSEECKELWTWLFNPISSKIVHEPQAMPDFVAAGLSPSGSLAT